MKTLVFARHPSGGIKTYIAYIYGNPVMSDIDVVLVTPATGNAGYFAEKLGEKLVYIESRPSGVGLLKALWSALRKYRPELIHSHGFTAGVLAALPARLLGIKHIVTTHDVFHPSQFNGIKGKIKWWLLATSFAMVDCINPVGEDASANLLEFFPALEHGGRVRAICNGIEVSAFLADGRRNLKREVGLPEESLLAGFFGRFMAQKGFRYLVDLVERWNRDNQQQPLHVACFGWGGFIREEQQSLRQRQLEKYFHFFDNTDDMPAALRGVDVVTMPSRWEACPLLAMEAVTAGAPLIASDCIGNAEVVAGTPALVFRSGCVDAFYRALADFVQNRQAIARRSEAFRQEAARRFDINQTAVKLREVYSSLTKAPRT